MITGMAAATLQPAAGAAGELTGLLLMRAYHEARGDVRTRVDHPRLGPRHEPGLGDARRLRGRRPSPTDDRGLRRPGRAEGGARDRTSPGSCSPTRTRWACSRRRSPRSPRRSTRSGGLLYYDGANLNAILGVVRPGDMGFDIVHMNLHKTFATPHGGGGPGAGPVAVSERLVDFLPGPRPVRGGARARLRLGTPARSIGRVHTWHGNALVLARALAYIDVHGGDGLRRVAAARGAQRELAARAPARCYDVPYDRPCMHECVLSDGHAQARAPACGPSTSPSAAGGGLPRADGLLPAHRRRGADDRADRDREPRDRRRVRRSAPGDRRGGLRRGRGRRGPRRGTTCRGRPRSDDSTRRAPHAVSSRPSTPAGERSTETRATTACRSAPAGATRRQPAKSQARGGVSWLFRASMRRWYSSSPIAPEANRRARIELRRFVEADKRASSSGRCARYQKKIRGPTVERPFRAHAETEVLVNVLSDRLGTPEA